jgi:hypothetical protein
MFGFLNLLKDRVPCTIDHEKHIEMLLMGGGARGPGHCGLLKALDERRISVGMVSGISIGSCVAALWTNGYDWERILKIMRAGMARLNPLNPDPALLEHGPFSYKIGARKFINLHQLFSDIQAEHHLKPNERLRILAYDILRRKPVVFEGLDYDLPLALAASCAIPGIMSMIWQGRKDQSGLIDLFHAWWHDHGDQLLVDGGVHSFEPDYFCNRPAIVSKIGFASGWPKSGDNLTPFVYIWHLAEMLLGKFFDKDDPDSKHITVRVGLPDVCALAFGLPAARAQEMVDHSYRQACTVFDAAIAKGLLPLRTD